MRKMSDYALSLAFANVPILLFVDPMAWKRIAYCKSVYALACS